MSTLKRKVIDAFRKLEDLRNQKKDPNINKILFKKYKILKIISIGKFSSLYEGINIHTKQKVAIKLEEINKYNLLEKEAYTLFTIKGYGIIDLISFGKNNKYNIMVQPLLGDSLHKFFINHNYNFSKLDICLIAIQCLERIEWIHKNNIIHRDIKPDNFLFGIKDPRIIYMIDFGLSKKYRSKRTFKHIKYSYTRKIIGTARYASVNSLKGFEMSRRDDLEAFYYMIIFFFLQRLPWQDIKEKSRVLKYHKILTLKCIFDIDDYKILLPNEIIKMFKYVKNLKFEEEPNYSLIKNSFRSILYNIGHTENETFSWIKDIRILNSKVSPNITLRKSSLKKRIFDRLDRNRVTASSLISLARNNKSNLTDSLTGMNTIKQSQKSNYNVYTLTSEEINSKNYEFSATPENKIYKIQKLNQFIMTKPTKLNKNVLKNLKVGNNLNNKKIQLKLNYNKDNEITMSSKRLKMNTNKNNYKQTYLNTDIGQCDYSQYIIKSNLNLPQNQKLLNKIKNYNIKKDNANIFKNNFHRVNTNIQKKYLDNNKVSRNNTNQILILNKDGILKFHDNDKFIINNTFINNFNNRNIININSKKKNNPNLFISLKKKNNETKNIYDTSKSVEKDNYFGFNINQ